MKILALDIGLKRIGVAYTPDGKITMPINAVIRKNRDQASAEVKNLLIEYSIDILVVGIPKGGSSQEEMSRRIKHFVNLINFEKEIFFQDEYGSSIEALELKNFRNQKKNLIPYPPKLFWIDG